MRTRHGTRFWLALGAFALWLGLMGHAAAQEMDCKKSCAMMKETCVDSCKKGLEEAEKDVTNAKASLNKHAVAKCKEICEQARKKCEELCQQQKNEE